eukprot:14312245-Ditylum_brightwellii.AAC.1
MCIIAEDTKKAIKYLEETAFEEPTLQKGKEQNRHTEVNKIEDSTATIYFNNKKKNKGNLILQLRGIRQV